MSARWTCLAAPRAAERAERAEEAEGECKASEPPSASSSNPAARSGHAMALLPPTGSVLLFGGADGRVFFDDFHVLEPAHYTHGDDSDVNHPDFKWKRLVTTHAPARHASPCVSDSQQSTASNNSPSARRRRSSLVEPLHAGAGRDYHSMHYVPQSPGEEQARGLRVLVVGNVVIAGGGRGSDSGALAFEMQELRVEEVRVRQTALEAQWVPRRVDSMFKPRARHAHSSALIHGQQLFVFGGKSATSSSYFNDLFYYDVAINQWRKPAVAGPAPAARAFASLAASDEHDKLFLYGGTDGRETFGSLFLFDVRLSRWDALAGGSVTGDRPACRVGHSLTFVAPQQLVVFGGRQRAKRQNQLFMFDILKRSWRQVSGQADEDEELPVGRTAHAAVLYNGQKAQPSSESSSAGHQGRLIVFGGYAGSHRWLDDLYAVSLPTVEELAMAGAARTTTQRQQQSQPPRSDQESRLTVSGALLDATSSQLQADKPVVEAETPAKPLFPHQTQPPRHQLSENDEAEATTASRPLAQSQPSVRGSSSSVRGESQNSGVSSGSSSGNGNSSGVLTDITNHTPTSPRPSSSQPVVSKPNANASMSSSLSSVSASPFKSNKRRRLEENSQRQPPAQGQDHSGSSSSDSTVVTVGLQTALLQVLQRQSDLEQGIVRIESLLTTHPPPHTHHHPGNEAPTSPWPTPAPSSSPCLDSYVRLQNEALESRLETLRRKYEALDESLKRSEADKAKLREQLVARETELYEAKRSLERHGPPLSDRVRAIEDAASKQLATAHVIENKISAVHDMLEELRHAGGDGTEAEDSPEKRLGTSPGVEPQLASPPLFYPHRVILGLEERLRSSTAEQDALRQQLVETQAKLARAEEKEERARQFFASWYSQDQQPSSTLSLPAP